MRISPLGIFGASRPAEQIIEWAKRDAYLTHPNRVCVDINVLYVLAIAHAIRQAITRHQLYEDILGWAVGMDVQPSVLAAIRAARSAPPSDYIAQQGWVLIAFQNALWQLLNATTLEEGVVDTVMRGGDTDTNAAICGALLGAVYGREAIPAQWEAALLSCRPEHGRPGVYRPRPEVFWPVDALELAAALVGNASRGW
jgi:ADP-ribosylglycohydrolase